jgi:hypothetical protein
LKWYLFTGFIALALVYGNYVALNVYLAENGARASSVDVQAP